MPSPLRPCADCPTLVRPPTVRCHRCAVVARGRIDRRRKAAPATSERTTRAVTLAQAAALVAADSAEDAEELRLRRRALLTSRAADWGLLTRREVQG